MSLKQLTTAGGSITLAPTCTANNYTLNIPAENGTLATLGDIPSAFASGTKILFPQAAAPTGWTQCVSVNDYAIRVVNTAGGGSGGTVAFSTAFASKSVSGTVGATTLSTTQIPSHAHTYNTVGTAGPAYGPMANPACGQGPYGFSTSAVGGGASHTHCFSGTAINLAVQYVNTIIGVKN